MALDAGTIITALASAGLPTVGWQITQYMRNRRKERAATLETAPYTREKLLLGNVEQAVQIHEQALDVQRAQIEDLTRRNMTMRAELDAAEAEVRHLREQVETLMRRVRSLQDELEQVRDTPPESWPDPDIPLPDGAT